MSNKTKSDTTQSSTARHAKQKADLQSTADAENAIGLRGIKVDPTPNENYTVAGVTAGKPTPETHVKEAKAAREASGIGLSGIEDAHREHTETSLIGSRTKTL